MTDTDCVCGVCRDCRIADRDINRLLTGPPVTTPGPLSERVRLILAEPVTTPAVRKPAKKKPTVAEGRPRRTNTYTETPCTRCGGMRAVMKIGRGYVLSGRGDLCEVCDGETTIPAKLAAHESGEQLLVQNERLRLTRWLERVLRDGRAYHPKAPHGSLYGYGQYGCRCAPCRAAKSTDKKERTTT